MSGALADKVLVVTGGASGIGLATAILAARSGAAGIVLADRDPDALAAAEDALRAQGCKVEAVALDVTSPDGPDAIAERAVARFGRLDAAVNAAGTEGGEHPLDTCEDTVFDAVMNVNVRGGRLAVLGPLIVRHRRGPGGRRGAHRLSGSLRRSMSSRHS
jgi:NAD(P)-dependent dehydrogenase (short-subunit alcohol dehydrogenase family)